MPAKEMPLWFILVTGDVRFNHLRSADNGNLMKALFGDPAKPKQPKVKPAGCDDYAGLVKMRFAEKPSKPARLEMLRRDRKRAPFLCHHI